jgi:hypothetical protein
MIQTQGFASSQNIHSLTDEINRWLVSNTKEMDTKFRLIDIKYAVTAEPSPSSGQHAAINYSALFTYEIGELKKTDVSSEPLETSGAK